ncbi:MAG TPA: choice-of-anchor Q domain-containing protein [Lacunisphaera sp.]|nr:choice-of-anchor Q domain-containing protein [Lacunisphaera sp.]
MKTTLLRLCLVFAWWPVWPALGGAEYFLDPVAGKPAHAGTREAPWGSLEAVAASDRVFAAGDVLVLKNGHHGSPVLRQKNPGAVTIRPEAGARATVKNLTISGGRWWVVEGVEISPETSPTPERVLLLRMNGSDNVIRRCVLYTVLDTSQWSAADWNARACDGISVSGTRQLVEDNHLANVRFAISVSVGALHNTVRGNLVDRFSGDGIRGMGDYGIYEGNVIKNLYQVNANHPDGFQSWSQTGAGVGKGVVKGVVVRGNYFLSYDDPKRPFRGALQGIGCFDGFFEDWEVENNVVLTSAWHGIAFYGARNCRIVNNTVADLNPAGRAKPWIKITAHKDGRPSTGNLVRNNLSSHLSIDRGAAQVDHNLVAAESWTFFAGWAAHDLRLGAASKAIDVGTSAGAPALDVLGHARFAPGNTACDVGAYEFGGVANGSVLSAGLPWEPRLNVPLLPASAASVD